ncbi:DNA topoisomerase VI subunit B [Streptacidiphilus sp. MAP12-16]|uniref:ATP-binding protein n=1 Tax=Streptacidiphilus sp. MAP12-16 TaxID=3156300 RepID=UPI003515AF18
MPTLPVVQRSVFSTPRSAEFLDKRSLQSQTGQDAARFGRVVVKELLDNALDAAESAGLAPEIGIAVTTDHEPGVVRVTVTDNGPGLLPEVVGRILNFNDNVSDKETLRSPTRGMQGNAFKTLLGIPCTLGVTAPVVIGAHGVRHEIAVSLDPDGVPAIRHETSPSTRTTGTSVSVPLPAGLLRAGEVGEWLQKFAFVNPHALLVEHAHSGFGEEAGIYKPTAGGKWRKPLPTDPTSAHHYDLPAMEKLVFGHVREAARGGKDMTLREFVVSFAGLSGSVKAQKVTALLPGITRMSGFKDSRHEVAVLLAAMRQHSRPPKPSSLGRVDRTHYEHVLDHAFGLDQAWFARKELTDHAGIPWVIEATVARTHRAGRITFAVNYSPTYSDPLANTTLIGDTVTGYGVSSFLDQADAAPDPGNQYQRAAVLHLICPAPQFTDKGKATLVVPREVANACAAALDAATKALQRAHRSKRRAESAQLRAVLRTAKQEAKAARTRKTTVKDAVAAVIEEAVAQARGAQGLSFSSHTLFYKIRPLALKPLPAGTKLSAPYVEQTLIPGWEREHHPIQGLYREPRGTLHHPHDPSGSSDVRLGTREVQQYFPPAWSFDKILVIEKTGLWPPVKEAGLAEKYDMAVITNEGYSTEACRDLLAALPPGKVQIFVLHDADPHGYNIARTLGEQTARMPRHHIEVIDLGLSVEDAIAKDLESEPEVRTTALPAGIVPHLSQVALDWFTGEEAARNRKGKVTQWHCQRVELNAFSSPELIAYIEEGLARHGATGKVVPPDSELRFTAETAVKSHLKAIVAQTIAHTLQEQRILHDLTAAFDTSTLAAIDQGAVQDYLAAHPHQSWHTAVDRLVHARMGAHQPALHAHARNLLTQQIAATTT